ncbi:MAG TPA: helix-turn-helix domain-containing protein [Stellaceae bacterium]|jgi:AraC-like DNA-binding protein|nr:helix-turn-helix domain-containing protein [Stellaceae bacterium]HEX3415525.1 helix-turn-helix domain-containing protein [Stellaceae bacterium]
MASSVRPASSSDTPAQHAEDVYLVAQGNTPPNGIEQVSASWRRSATEHGVDPLSSEAPRILLSHELKDFREPLDELIFSAQEEIDRLYRVVREAGYTVLFCDTAGVAVEHRGDNADASRFRYWGTWLGGMWSEALEGTNGIGTCIAEERPITVHRGQHFRSRHINLSCSTAPIFDVDGKLMAVLDVSAIDPQLSERAHALTGALTATAARAISGRLFRERFRREWILAVSPIEDGEPGMLLAVDSHQRIVGADRAARTSLLLDDQRLRTGVSLWSFFERDLGLFRHKEAADVATRLTIAGSSEAWPALVTPPESALGAQRSGTSAALHTHPPVNALASLRQQAPAAQARGGLPPGAMRRVREYVDAHLGESMDLAELAAIAGLSVFHFARQFKQSAGVTPHSYLVQRRIERAQDMLARTDLALSEIAVAAGFSDQSHLARHFRQLLGTTPREFRWSQR